MITPAVNFPHAVPTISSSTPQNSESGINNAAFTVNILIAEKKNYLSGGNKNAGRKRHSHSRKLG